MRVTEYQKDITELRNKGELDFILCWTEEVNGEPSVCCSKDNKTLQVIPAQEWNLDIEKLTEGSSKKTLSLTNYYNKTKKYIPATLTGERKTINISYTKTPNYITLGKIVNNEANKHVWVSMEFLKYFDNPTFTIRKVAPMLYSVGVYEGDKFVGIVKPMEGL